MSAKGEISADVVRGIAEVARVHLGDRGNRAYADAGMPLEARLVEDLELDSIERLTLAVEVENHFRICLDEDESSIVTVADLCRAVQAKLSEKASAAPGSRG